MKTGQWLPLMAMSILFFGSSSCSDSDNMDPPAGNQVLPTLQNVATYAFDDETLDPMIFSTHSFDGGNLPSLAEPTEEYGSQYLWLDGGYVSLPNPLRQVKCQTAASLTFMMLQPERADEDGNALQDLTGALISFENENGSERLFLTANGWLHYEGMDGHWDDNNPADATTGYITPGTWHKVALIVRNTGYSLYVDGERKVNKLVPDFDCSKIVRFMNEASTIYIGNGSDENPAAWGIDDLNIYRNEITAKEYSYTPGGGIGGGNKPDYSKWLLVGEEDNSAPWWSVWSPNVPMTGDGTVHYEFMNYGNGQNNWNNWVLVITNGKYIGDDGYAEHVVIRSDAYGWGTLWEGVQVTHNYDFDTFIEDMQGAFVTMDITRVGASLTITAKAECENGKTLDYKLVFNGVDTPEIGTFFALDGSHLLFNPETTMVGNIYEPGTHVTGLTDCSTPWWSAFSELQTFDGPFKNFGFEFVNNNAGNGGNWNNWLVVCTNGKAFGEDGYEENYVLRSDAYGWGGKYEGSTMTSAFNWDTYVADMNGAKCRVYFTFDGNKLTMVARQTTAEGVVMPEYRFVTPGLQAPLGIFFTCELAWLDFTRIGYFPWADMNPQE